VRIATPGEDYLTDFNTWLDAQDGADFRGRENYEKGARLIVTPRDLCTYVHYDAPYQAYVTACLAMLANSVPFSPDLPFDTHGGARILSLVTEVATRALKAVRYQKYNIHRRLRTEAVAGLIDVNIRSVGKQFPEVNCLVEHLQPILCKVKAHNQKQNLQNGNSDGGRINGTGSGKTSSGKRKTVSLPSASHLLPMAFPEGSPMHCSYGSGHACVAAACVTILKAFFDSNYELNTAFEVKEDGSGLRELPLKRKLKVGDELNKLAENISIGRNWAGVHYFSDYFESFKLGEKIAIGILEEQKLLFPENFYWSVDLFDGTTIRI